MQMTPEQARLREEYESRLPALFEALQSRRKSYSAPHLLNLDAHDGRYWRCRRRLLVVGQETRGWLEGAQFTDFWAARTPNIDVLMKQYEDFELGRAFYRNAPFCAACHQLSTALDPSGPEWGFAWTNLFKVDEDHGRPSDETQEVLGKHFDVLAAEIDAARPHVIVFLTGSPLDWRIDQALGTPAVHSQLPGYPVRVVSRISSPKLPTAAYRTYHPNYLRRSGQWKVLDAIVRDAESPAVGGRK